MMASFLYWAAIGALGASVESLVLPAHVPSKFAAPAGALANFGGHRIPISVGRSLSTRTKRWVSAISTETFQVDEIPPLTLAPPLKVGLIVEPTPFTHVSGYSNRYQELLRYLSKAGDSVEIVCPDDSENPPKDFLSYPISYTPGFRFSLYNSICLSYDYNLVGAKMLERYKPDIVHVTTPGCMAITSTIAAKLYDVPLVLSYHTHLPVYAERYLGFVPFIVDLAWLVIKYLHSKADLTLVTSPQMKAEFEEHGVRGVEVWRKGVDTATFSPKWRSPAARDELTDGHPEDLLLVYVGRLGREKRLEDLVPVMRDSGLNVRLAIVGTGPHEGALRAAFEGTKTVFTGLKQGQALWEAFASADLFCMPSDSETLGFVVLESLASGVPVIGADAGGIPDLIQEGQTGHLFPPGDKDAILALVRRFAADPQRLRTMGAKGRAYAESYSWESATSVLRNVQYPAATAAFRAARARLSPPRRAAEIGALVFVGVWTGAVVWVGCFVDALIQKLRPAN